MQRLEVSGEVRPIYGSLGVKRLRKNRSIEVTGRQGRRWKQLLGDLKEKRVYWKLKEVALD